MTQMAPQTADRDVLDALGEALRRHYHGVIRPTWADLPESERRSWCESAAIFCTVLASVGLGITHG